MAANQQDAAIVAQQTHASRARMLGIITGFYFAL